MAKWKLGNFDEDGNHATTHIGGRFRHTELVTVADVPLDTTDRSEERR